MPDITITCESCGERISISEYAAPLSLTCSGCGKALTPPQPNAPHQRPTLKKRAIATPDFARTPPEPARSEKSKKKSRRERPPVDEDGIPGVVTAQVRDGTVAYKTSWINQHSVSWLLIILLGAPLAYLRFGGVVEPAMLTRLGDGARIYGPLVVFAFHLLIAVEAFKDEFFLGICALIIPGYSLIYLYTRSENYVVRVVFTLYAIALGVETYEGTMVYMSSGYHRVNAWIQGNEYEAGY